MGTSTTGASWLGTQRPSERPLPSWMAPRGPVEPALTSWAAPPRDRGSITNPRAYEAVARSAHPRISVLAEGGVEVGSRMPPPPGVPNECRESSSSALRDFSAEIQELTESARQSLLEARREALETSEREIVKLALAVAERVIGRELEAHPEAVARWVREGIDALGSTDEATCVVSPKVAEVLMSAERFRMESRPPDVVVDATLSGYACEVRGRFGRVDMGLAARLDAVRVALGAEDEEAGS